MSIQLQAHQSAVLDYFIANPDSRGLILWHGTGSGKTLTAIAVSEHMQQYKQVLIMAPKSLHDNFANELKKVASEKSQERYSYVSTNASNLLTKLETQQDEITGLDIKSLGSLDNKFIIIDEAHNMLTGMSNGSKNATGLYDLLMRARNCKILLLTASGIINNIFEAVIALNIVKGPIRIEKGYYGTLLPEDNETFIKYFIDEKNMAIKNQDKLRNRIQGLVSYKGALFEHEVESFYPMLKRTIKKQNYPDRLPIKVDMVPMSSTQFSAYSAAREKERMETKQAIKGKGIAKEMISIKEIVGGALTKSSSFSRSTSYRIRSRQISNILIPEEKEIDIAENIQKYSPKIFKIGERVKKGHKAIIYSNFVKAGINPMSAYLEHLGFVRYDPNDLKETSALGYYGVYTGEVSTEDRTATLEAYNSDNGNLKVLLISSSGAEGLSAMGTREVHIMEPYWNWERCLQVMARGIRYLSHEHLPENERNVQVYIYLADYPEGYKEAEVPTDIYLFKESVKKYEINAQMTKLLASTAVDCDTFNKGINFKCYKCKPTDGSPIYLPDLDKDMLYENPCANTSLILKEFTLSGATYYVSNEGKLYSKIGDKYMPIIDRDIVEYIAAKMPQDVAIRV